MGVEGCKVEAIDLQVVGRIDLDCPRQGLEFGERHNWWRLCTVSRPGFPASEIYAKAREVARHALIDNHVVQAAGVPHFAEQGSVGKVGVEVEIPYGKAGPGD